MSKEKKKLFLFEWRIWHFIGLLLLIAALVLFGILSGVKSHDQEKLIDQRLVSRWSDKNDYAQVSVLFPYGTILEETDIKSAEHTFQQALTDISMFEENTSQRLFVDCIYETGNVTVSREKTSVDVEAVGVSKDFFLFHPLHFVSGGPIPTNTDLTDYVVLDEKTAWNLFGAIDVEGMQVRIGDVPHIISGVIKTDSDTLSTAGGSKENVVYITRESLSLYGSVNSTIGFELLMPEPYEGFALDSLKKAFKTYETTGEWIDHTKRFGWKHLWNVWKERKSRIMQTKPIVFPYWENVARFYENKFVHFGCVMLVCLFLSVVIAIWELVSIWKMRNFDKEDVKDAWIYFVERQREKRKHREVLKEDEDYEKM